MHTVCRVYIYIYTIYVHGNLDPEILFFLQETAYLALSLQPPADPVSDDITKNLFPELCPSKNIYMTIPECSTQTNH